jgi:hypothetical protein
MRDLQELLGAPWCAGLSVKHLDIRLRGLNGALQFFINRLYVEIKRDEAPRRRLRKRARKRAGQQ